MNLKYLRYFYWVSKLGSYSRAADQMGITEPGIHRAVQGLERDLGVKLVCNEKGRIRPTYAGRILQEYGERVDQLEVAAKESVDELVMPAGGSLLFGLSRPLADRLARCLISWKERRADTRLGIVVALRNELYVRTLSGELDFAVAPLAKLPLGLTALETVFHNEVVLVAHAGHHLSGRRVVSPAELAGETFVTSFPLTMSHALVMEIGEKAGFRPKVFAEVDYAETVVDLVASGAGVGILSKHMVAEAVKRGELSIINLTGYPLEISYGFIFRSGVTPSRTVRSLVAHLSRGLN